MTLSKAAFKEIVSKYDTLLLMEDDPVSALDFAHDLLNAEADAISKKYPYATHTIADLTDAIFRLNDLASDISNEEFSDGEED